MTAEYGLWVVQGCERGPHEGILVLSSDVGPATIKSRSLFYL